MITKILPGCRAGGRTDEEDIKFDLNTARDIGILPGLTGSFEMAGKIQQTCSGSLIN